MYRRIDKGMKKTVAVVAVAALSFAMLAGCGSKTVEPPAKSPDTTSPTTTAPDTLQEDREAVAQSVVSLYATLSAESKAFAKNNKKISYAAISYAAIDGGFPKSFAVYDLPAFDTKKHTYFAIFFDGLLAAFVASESPKVSVSDLYAIKDISAIKITGDKATLKSSAITGMKSIKPVEEIAFNKVDGKWLLDGARYTNAYFKTLGVPAGFTIK